MASDDSNDFKIVIDYSGYAGGREAAKKGMTAVYRKLFKDLKKDYPRHFAKSLMVYIDYDRLIIEIVARGDDELADRLEHDVLDGLVEPRQPRRGFRALGLLGRGKKSVLAVGLGSLKIAGVSIRVYRRGRETVVV